jgi:hypothetical protein
MDRAREFRARGDLDGRGFIAQADQTVAGKVRFFLPTAKGTDWAERRKVRVKRYKSGIVHEYLLTQVERRIGALGPRWRLQRNSSIARDQGLQPDLLVLAPGGGRIIVEICCNNLPYDAGNLLAETKVAAVAHVVAVTPDQRTARALEAALTKAAEAAGTDWRSSAKVLHAGQCLAKEFDWPEALGTKTAPGSAGPVAGPTDPQPEP